MRKVRIGIIGFGEIARGRHVTELLDCPDAEIVAVCDISDKALEKAKEKLGISDEKCYKDYRDLIVDPDVDAVEVCTPNYMHAEIAIAALNAGKPVNLEKPVAMNYEQALKIVEAERNSTAFGMTCFTYRFFPAVRYAKHLVDNGIVGDIIGLNVAYLKNSAFWEGRRLEWRFVKDLAGSGVVGDLAVHLIDLAQLLAGDIVKLCATCDINIKERTTLDGTSVKPVETEDSCSFLARFESGAEGSFHITRSAMGHKNTIRYDVYGTKGSISFDLNDPTVLAICTGEGDPKDYKTVTEKVPEEFYITQERAFVNAIKGEKCEHYPSVERGAQGQKVVDAILRSAEEERWITV